MSIEKQARRALRRLVLYRCLTAIAAAPADLFGWIAGAFNFLTRLCREAETAIFYLELDAAREYRLLTGVDMGVATGSEERYMGTRPGAWPEAEADEAMSYEDAGRALDEDDD